MHLPFQRVLEATNSRASTYFADAQYFQQRRIGKDIEHHGHDVSISARSVCFPQYMHEGLCK